MKQTEAEIKYPNITSAHCKLFVMFLDAYQNNYYLVSYLLCVWFYTAAYKYTVSISAFVFTVKAGSNN